MQTRLEIVKLSIQQSDQSSFVKETIPPSQLQIDFIDAKLSTNEIVVLKGRLAINGKSRTLENIGLSLGVTRERIRQIEKKALNKLIGFYSENGTTVCCVEHQVPITRNLDD